MLQTLPSFQLAAGKDPTSVRCYSNSYDRLPEYRHTNTRKGTRRGFMFRRDSQSTRRRRGPRRNNTNAHDSNRRTLTPIR